MDIYTVFVKLVWPLTTPSNLQAVSEAVAVILFYISHLYSDPVTTPYSWDSLYIGEKGGLYLHIYLSRFSNQCCLCMSMSTHVRVPVV